MPELGVFPGRLSYQPPAAHEQMSFFKSGFRVTERLSR